jgi:hypothetical protein
VFHNIGAQGLFAISAGIALAAGVLFTGYFFLQKNKSAD